MEEEKDLSNFDIYVHDLFDVSKQILDLFEKRNLKLSNKRNVFLDHLRKYTNIYGKTDPKEHTDYFFKIYERNKKFILLGPQRDNWLIDGSVCVTFGGEENIRSNCSIHLSCIYNNAVKLRDEITEELSGFPDSKNSNEVLYPFRMMLVLYKIFAEICESNNDKTKLKTHIELLENKIGIKKQSAGGGMSDFLDIATGAAEKLTGTKIPRDKIPQASEIHNMFNGLINDPKAKDMIGGIVQKFQSGEGLGELVNGVLGGLGGIAADKKGAAPVEAALSSSSSSSSSNNSNNTSNVNDEFADF